MKALAAGASAYVLKINAAEDLIQAIHAAAKGKRVLRPEVAALVAEARMQRPNLEDWAAYDQLGKREKQVLQLVVEGKTSGEIATALEISSRTVEAHRNNIKRKLGISTTAELTKFAIREGLLALE